MKAIQIDWDGLQAALTWRSDENGMYLDVPTGEVVSFTGLEPELALGEIDSGLTSGRLVPIEPLASSVEYGWMEEFVATIAAGALHHRLENALAGRRAPFRQFKDVLAGHPSERERWFAFHDERVLEAAREWLEENGIMAGNDASSVRHR